MFILIVLLVVASVIIVLQAKAARAMKVTLVEERNLRNKYFNAYSKAQTTISGLEAAYESRRSTHEADRRRATKSWRELKDAYNALLDERMAALLKR